MSSFITIWEYKVKAERKAEFEKLYGLDGAWVKLFKKFPGYVRTELIRDLDNDSVYITIDYWKSKEAYSSFKEESKEEFSGIDKKGEELTLEEKHIGDFINNP